MNDFVLGGQVHGDQSIASLLMSSNCDPRVLRPYLGDDNRSYVTTNGRDGKPVALVTNTPATLRKDEWKIIDDAVRRAAMPRLRLYGDIRGAGLQYTIPNAMGKTVLESSTMTNINPATISMDAIRQGENDRPEFDITNFPLPIIHKDFYFTLRQIMVSRNGQQPLDTTMAELSARKVAEEVEKLTLGVSSSYSYGGGTVYGLTNYPSRNTQVLTLPTAVGWTPQTLFGEILEMKAKAVADFHYGPYRLYFSPNWDVYLDNDYSPNYSGGSLRDRLSKIDGVGGIGTLDYLTGWQILLVQFTSDVVRAVVGMEIQTLQWESHGGMQLNYKVMAILLTQLRSDADGNTGIVHGTAA